MDAGMEALAAQVSVFEKQLQRIKEELDERSSTSDKLESESNVRALTREFQSAIKRLQRALEAACGAIHREKEAAWQNGRRFARTWNSCGMGWRSFGARPTRARLPLRGRLCSARDTMSWQRRSQRP